MAFVLLNTGCAIESGLPVRPVIQPAAFDVANWLEDEQYFNYPEGARAKRAFFPPADLTWRSRAIKLNRRFLYKKSNKRYLDQFWGEVVAYHVGCFLDVEVPATFAAYDSRDAGDCGSLSQWFYDDGDMSYIPGGNWMQRSIPEYDRKRGEMHNFRTIQALGRTIAPDKDPEQDWGKWWAEAFLFDALIGNTDRHQDNWGYLSLRSGDRKLERWLSPLFDNGTSLGHERFPDLLLDWTKEQFDEYVMSGKHRMRWHLSDEERCGHFEMVAKVVERFPGARAGLRQKIYSFSIDDLAKSLDLLKCLHMPISLRQSRIDLYLKLISLRQQKLKEVLS